MQELYTNIPAEFQNLTPQQATEQMVALVRGHCVPSIFRPMSLSPVAKASIDYRNSCVIAERKHFRYDHLPEVFLGAQVPWDPPHTPVLTPNEIRDMIGLAGIIQRQQLSLL